MPQSVLDSSLDFYKYEKYYYSINDTLMIHDIFILHHKYIIPAINFSFHLILVSFLKFSLC